MTGPQRSSSPQGWAFGQRPPWPFKGSDGLCAPSVPAHGPHPNAQVSFSHVPSGPETVLV